MNILNQKNENLTGVFDSGVGGLTVLSELIKNGGNYLYFADMKNLPYGNRSKEEIICFTRDIIKFFISKNVKKVVMACNTSSALAYESLNSEFGHRVKIYPLIQTAAPAIAKSLFKGKIGVMATNLTAKSCIYTKEILKYNKNLEVFEIPCPEFVDIVENSLYDKKESIECIKMHIQNLLDKKVNKIVLGCTHYPHLMPLFKRFAPESMFINPAKFMANAVFGTNISPNSISANSNVKFYTTGAPETFIKNAGNFIKIKGDVEFVQLENSFAQVLVKTACTL